MAELNSPPVDIVIPIYGDREQTQRCIESVLSSTCCTPFELLLIWDCGPDPELLTYLRNIADQPGVLLFENTCNLGFVISANQGMQQHPDRDLVLLNSDTEVANDWLDRLLDCARSDQMIATVTPFSNNAEIVSFPELCVANALPYDLDVATIDRTFADHVEAAALDIPTGVGFCMLVRRFALSQLGNFDEVLFSRGYGEENDFCRRASRAGFRNVQCTNVFVFHQGATSFGEERQHLLEDAMKILDRKYPDYHRRVHDYILKDPSRPYRIQAALALIRITGKPLLLTITHNLGGGTNRYINQLRTLLADEVKILVLRPCEHYLLELSIPGTGLLLWFDLRYQRPQFIAFCRQAGIARVHLQHTMGLEASILDLLDELELDYDLTVHDYFLINGNPTLTDEYGRFCADPANRDKYCSRRYPVPLDMSPEEWRQQSARLLDGADRIIVGCKFAANIFQEYFPGLKTTFAWHPDYEMNDAYAPPRCPEHLNGEVVRIAVLGALSVEKGAEILETVAMAADRIGLAIEFHLLGYAHRQLNVSVLSHGPYDDEELDKLLSETNPHLLWFPSLWPETYSFTLSAGLRNGLPIIAPDFGAFSERLNHRPYSRLVPPLLSAGEWLDQLQRFIGVLFDGAQGELTAYTTTTENQDIQRYPDFYRLNYCEPMKVNAKSVAKIELKLIRPHTTLAGRAGGEHGLGERLLLGLYQLRTMRAMAPFAAMIPIGWQRRVKRFLSARPIHELKRHVDRQLK